MRDDHKLALKKSEAADSLRSVYAITIAMTEKVIGQQLILNGLRP